MDDASPIPPEMAAGSEPVDQASDSFTKAPPTPVRLFGGQRYLPPSFAEGTNPTGFAEGTKSSPFVPSPIGGGKVPAAEERGGR